MEYFNSDVTEVKGTVTDKGIKTLTLDKCRELGKKFFQSQKEVKINGHNMLYSYVMLLTKCADDTREEVFADLGMIVVNSGQTIAVKGMVEWLAIAGLTFDRQAETITGWKGAEHILENKLALKATYWWDLNPKNPWKGWTTEAAMKQFLTQAESAKKKALKPANKAVVDEGKFEQDELVLLMISKLYDNLGNSDPVGFAIAAYKQALEGRTNPVDNIVPMTGTND